ncbi:hypothetical protein ACFL0K_00285 [Patescibacteria group bacterium]
MREEQEIRKSFKVEVNKTGFLRVSFFEDIIDIEENARRAELVAADFYNIFDREPDKKFNILIDISKMNKSHISEKANEIYRNVARREQVIKVAIIGRPGLQSRVLSFVLPFMKGEGKKVLWFLDEKKAVSWLGISKE